VKILFFNAAADPHDRVSTLAKNVEHTLRPFDRYLHQAIQTAKQRQFRYQLPWRKVRDIQTFKLTPIDTVLLIPRKRPGLLLKNWPMGKPWDLCRKGFVSNRDENVVFTQAVLNESGLRVESDDPLKPADQVIWCDVTCEVAYESEPFKPREIRTLKGHKLNIRRIMSVPDGTEWCVVVEGIVTERLVLVDSERIEVMILKPFDRVSSTSDANGVSYDIVSSGKIRSRNAPAEGYLTDESGTVCPAAPPTAPASATSFGPRDARCIARGVGIPTLGAFPAVTKWRWKRWRLR
jgi:hypothetical protein